ncbi:unnamed protein product [Lactuca virosa]|uniref:Uncharacterized protein n=1 Tax=Lactuca virosa TaxID=75947 RepID=A0AAU9P302_9ASTR|nr:unnamed protein product [Lactuca virosa]
MLKYLKCLGLDDCKLLEKLPEDLDRLQHLERLDLGECTSISRLPHDICLLKGVRISGLRDLLQSCCLHPR